MTGQWDITPRTGRRAPGVVAAAAVLSCMVFGAASAEDPALPSAEQVINKHIEKTGGRAAYEKLHNMVAEGSMEYTGMGMKGTMTAYSAAPNKSFVTIEFEGLGQVMEGSDGDVVWEYSAIQGPRILEGEERAIKMRRTTFNSTLKWKELYAKGEVAGVESIGEMPCYKMIMTPKVGNPETWYIDKENYLLIKAEMSLKNPMGEIPVQAYFEDYREVGGILHSHKMVQKVMMQEMQMVFSSIKHNVDLPPDRFAVPEQIKPLLEKTKAPASQPATQPAP